MSSIIFSLIDQELQRQENAINLIASENYTSEAIMHATGSILTNKYAEGYPGRRYYGGCQIVDQIESYAIEQGKKLFDVDHMNVQPHSGSSANFAAYFSILKPGDTILGMRLTAGGHLTHGYSINFSGTLFKSISYGVNEETGLIDYDEVERLADEHKPKMIIAGASAYARLIDYKKFASIAQANNSVLLVDMAHIAGLIAAKIIPSPGPYADIITSTTHKTLRGPRSGFICSNAKFAQSIDKAIIPGTQGGPLLNVIAAKAIAFEEAQKSSFVRYQQQVINNAKIMAKTFKDLGYHIVSGGTDTHLFLVDLRSKINDYGQLSGKHVEEVLQKCNIIVNRNTVPGDTQSPMITSGIRIGTPAITTRGFKEQETQELATIIDNVIKNQGDDIKLKKIKNHVQLWCNKFKIYPQLIEPQLSNATANIKKGSCQPCNGCLTYPSMTVATP
jgi:glycine hydroxymethyltransferase